MSFQAHVNLSTSKTLDRLEQRRKQLLADVESGRTKVVPNIAMLRLKQAASRALTQNPDWVALQKSKKH